MKVTLLTTSALSIAAQAIASADPVIAMLTQVPFVLAIIWLFLKLADKQESMIKSIQERHTDTIKSVSDTFEEIDRRRSADNAALTSTLLSIIAEDNLNQAQTKKLAAGLRERSPSTRTQEYLLRKIEEE